MKRLSLILILVSIFNCADEPLEPEQRACIETTAALTEASSKFNSVTPENYTEICNEYRIALQNQKEFCGDGNGAIQTLLDTLGDCSGTTNDCELAETASNTAAGDYTEDASAEHCSAYKLALETQILVCGDDSGSIQTIIDGLDDCDDDDDITVPNAGCNGNVMRDALGQIIQCNYDSTESLVINNIYIEARTSSDEDGDDVHDHFLNIIHITDGTAQLDANNNFVAFENRTYIYSLSLYSLGTTGLEPGIYKTLFEAGNQAPFLSLVGSNYSRNDCTNDAFNCDDNNSILNGVVTLSGSSGNYELCFDSLLDFDDNCFKGNYSGDFTPIIIN